MIKIQTLEEIRANRKSQENHDSFGNGLPPVQRYGEPVPRGGTMCANCEYLKDRDNRICGNEKFIAWEGPDKPAGSAKIPRPINEYCSIWWERADKE